MSTITHHNDPESAIASLKGALNGLYPTRWADAYDMADTEPLDEICHAADALTKKVLALIREIDGRHAEPKTHSVVRSANQERLGASV